MQRPRGTKDIYGIEQTLKLEIEDNLRLVAELYNYQKIDTPIFEQVEVFKRSVGETSDIVTKELYEFKDKGNRLMVLRPEGTASIVRAIIENNLTNNPIFLKVYYIGQMFRYENPQQGRQRQFNQFGIENFNPKSPYVDVETIFMASQILKNLNISTKLFINSLGNKATRDKYSHALKKYFQPFKQYLSVESINRLENNPLRILDDKIDANKDFVKQAPQINQFYSNEEAAYFQTIIDLLNKYEIDYEIKHNLVRGLDYYTDTIFEFVPLVNLEGSQATLIAGGRFDNLMHNLGGPNRSGIGFAIGIERIINQLLINLDLKLLYPGYLIYLINLSEKCTETVLNLALTLRGDGFRTEWNVKPQKLLKAFEKSDVYKPSAIIIIGDKELSTNKVTIKFHDQTKLVAFEEVSQYLQQHLKNNGDFNENN